jgi:hypothetical protein
MGKMTSHKIIVSVVSATTGNNPTNTAHYKSTDTTDTIIDVFKTYREGSENSACALAPHLRPGTNSPHFQLLETTHNRVSRVSNPFLGTLDDTGASHLQPLKRRSGRPATYPGTSCVQHPAKPYLQTPHVKLPEPSQGRRPAAPPTLQPHKHPVLQKGLYDLPTSPRRHPSTPPARQPIRRTQISCTYRPSSTP